MAKAFVPRAPVVESKSGSMMIRVQGPKLAAHVEKATCARRTDIPVLRCGDSTRVAMTSSLARVFKIEASQGQTLSMDTCGAAATFDTVMEVYQGCPREIAFTSQVGEGYALANDDGVCPDGPSDASRLSGVVQLAGQELYVRVRALLAAAPAIVAGVLAGFPVTIAESVTGFPVTITAFLAESVATLSCGGEAIATVDMQFEGDWYLLDAPADALVQIDTCRDSTDVDTM
ncbi:hypothetical protein T492DRAFT_872483 [Pavlovales sp. CCMP2436]|nr:hypothetical protein T492DRAFT_872483 [Pavlovales sp. CCMP2436]